jgi:hypothetical protein
MNIQEFNYSVNLLQSILWQYDEATNLIGLINKKNSWYNVNQTQFWENWYNNVFNLLTANSFGLSVWSIILNLPLFLLATPEPDDAPIFGFNSFLQTGTLISGMNTVSGLADTSKMFIGQTLWDNNINIPNGTTVASIVDANNITMSANANGSATEIITFFIGNSYLNFGHYPRVGNQGGNFSNRGSIIVLTAEEQRFALRLKYYKLCSRGDVTDVNQFLNYLCATSNIGYAGTIYMLDNVNMTITYHFTTTTFPSALLDTIMQYDLFPRPAGVGILYSA